MEEEELQTETGRQFFKIFKKKHQGTSAKHFKSVLHEAYLDTSKYETVFTALYVVHEPHPKPTI